MLSHVTILQAATLDFFSYELIRFIWLETILPTAMSVKKKRNKQTKTRNS